MTLNQSSTINKQSKDQSNLQYDTYEEEKEKESSMETEEVMTFLQYLR